MRFKHAPALCAFALLASASRTAHAGGGAATDAYDGIRDDVALDVHGLADLYVQENLGAAASRAPQLRAFDMHAGAPAIGLVHVALAHKPDVVGFRVDVGVGDMANSYLHYDPASASHPDFSRGMSYVEQAFVTAIVPVGRGFTLDVGKFGTPVGLEENESLTNWNYSRSLLYLIAEPSYHAGARLTYPVLRTLALSAFWVNGWDATIFDGNGMRAGAAAVTWNPSDKTEIVVDYMGGLERAPTRLFDPAQTFRHELDFYATYDLTDRISFASTADYGRDAASGGVSWWGVAGYLRVRALPWLAGTLRGEHLADTNGFTTGTKQRLAEATATIETREQVGRVTMIQRLEYRRDRSDTRVFESLAAPLTRQDTVTAALIAAF